VLDRFILHEHRRSAGEATPKAYAGQD